MPESPVGSINGAELRIRKISNELQLDCKETVLAIVPDYDIFVSL